MARVRAPQPPYNCPHPRIRAAPWVRSESSLKSQTRYRRDFNRTWLRLEEERGRRDRLVLVRE